MARRYMDTKAGTYAAVLRPAGYDTDAKLLRFRARVILPDRSLRTVEVGVPVEGTLSPADFLFPSPETFDRAAEVAFQPYVWTGSEDPLPPVYRESENARRVKALKGAVKP
jgi:hypothetical protein